EVPHNHRAGLLGGEARQGKHAVGTGEEQGSRGIVFAFGLVALQPLREIRERAVEIVEIDRCERVFFGHRRIVRVAGLPLFLAGPSRGQRSAFPTPGLQDGGRGERLAVGLLTEFEVDLGDDATEGLSSIRLRPMNYKAGEALRSGILQLALTGGEGYA